MLPRFAFHLEGLCMRLYHCRNLRSPYLQLLAEARVRIDPFGSRSCFAAISYLLKKKESSLSIEWLPLSFILSSWCCHNTTLARCRFVFSMRMVIELGILLQIVCASRAKMYLVSCHKPHIETLNSTRADSKGVRI